MIYPIHFPNKKDSDLLKKIMRETKELTGIPYWRYLLTLCSEDLSKRRNAILKNQKGKK